MRHPTDRAVRGAVVYSPADAAALGFASRSRAVQHAYDQARRLARTDRPVLLLGESGVGKTIMARQIHLWSPRHEGPFVCVNLGAADEALVGSQLSGHVRGAYTGASAPRAGALVSARGGTLFGDEIGKADRGTQFKLLPIIDGQPITQMGSDCPIRVDVRLIFAANEPLDQLADDGRMVPELYARLWCWTITLPPLRERREDIPGLVERYIEANAAASGYDGRPYPLVDKRLESFLVGCYWTYNLRQLEGVVARIMAEAEGASVLTLDHLPEELYRFLSHPGEALNGKPTATERDEVIADALSRCNGNRAAAARLAGVSESSIRRYCKRIEGSSGNASPNVDAIGGQVASSRASSLGAMEAPEAESGHRVRHDRSMTGH